MGLFNFIFNKMVDKRIASFQNDLVKKHLDEVQNIYNQMRGWRHDYHNHIQTMLGLIDSENSNKEKDSSLRTYLFNLNDDLTSIDTVIKTGNVMLDAILNSKLSLIKSKNIAITAKATVPNILSISEINLCVIIGNLLDNALEACVWQSDHTNTDPFIRVYIGILKEHLYISVSNSISGEVKKSGKTYLSTKDSANHGFGLMRIDRIVNTYNGYVNRQNEDNVFATEIMLPL